MSGASLSPSEDLTSLPLGTDGLYPGGAQARVVADHVAEGAYPLHLLVTTVDIGDGCVTYDVAGDGDTAWPFGDRHTGCPEPVCHLVRPRPVCGSGAGCGT
jgi:hypothetical protein